MPKKVFTLNDFSGGLNTDKSSRALEDNELAVCKNLDPTSKGRVVCSRVFKNVTGTYADQIGTADAVNGITTGYGLFAFANDYTLADPPVVGHTGEFVVKSDGNASADIDILQPASTWIEGLVTAQSVEACFYAAEGDLFVGGDHAKAPRSLTYHAQTQIVSASVTAVNDWVDATQEKPLPTSGTTGTAQKIFQSSAGGTGTTTTASGQDILHWVIKPTSDDTGLWTNDQSDTAAVYQFACSWLYKGFDPVFGVNATESDLFELETGNSMTGAADFEDESISVQAWFGNATPITATHFTNKYGARLYSRFSGDGDGDWYLLAEMDLEKGIRGAGETDWNEWAAQTSAASQAFDQAADSGDSCATGLINAPPLLVTFKIANGYSTSDIPTSGLAYFRTAVIANSRAYVGNVKINGRTYGDRILKSPIFKYDVFTENSYLDVAINDGDQVTALAAHADRLLQFKHSAVYIINISKELEFLEDEQQGAGISWPAAVTTTPFGVVWINNNACYLYDGEKITQLQLGKISSTNWSTNINPVSATPTSIIGYDSIKQQVIVLWDATSSGSGEAYIFDAQTGSWYETDDIQAGAVNCTNMVNARGDKLLIGGNAAIDDINFLDNRASGTTATVDLQTKVFDFGNPESKKNLLEVAVVYKYGNAALDVNISADHAAYVEAGSGSEGLLTTAAGPTLVEINTSTQTAFKGKKTFQVQIEGTADELFELHSVSLTYRDLGVH